MQLFKKLLHSCHSDPSQLKALLLKEYWTHKKYIWLPCIIIFSVYTLLLLIQLVRFVHIPGLVIFSRFDLNMDEPTFIGLLDHYTSYTIVYFVSIIITILSTVLVVSNYMGLVASSLNDDYRNKCVLFHHALPVSLFRRLWAKFIYIAGSMPIQILVISVVNLLVALFFAKNISAMHLYYALLGLTQGLITMLILSMLYISASWFFSALFKEKTFWNTFGTLLGINISLILVSLLLGFNEACFRFLGYVMRLFSYDLSVTNWESTAHNDVQWIIAHNWINIFSTDMLIRVILTVVLFAAGTYIISKREVI